MQQITEKKRIKNSEQIAFKNDVNAKKNLPERFSLSKNEMISTIGVITRAKIGM